VIVRTANLLLKIAAVLFAAVGIGALALAWRLWQGPISLALLAPYVSQALNLADAGFTVAAEDTVLVWAGWERRLDIRALNAKVIGRDGQTVAVLPQAAIGLSATALIGGRLAPTAIEAIGPKLFVVHRDDGQFDFGIGQALEPTAAETDADATPPSLREILGGLLAALEQPGDRASPLGYLRRVSVIDAEVTLDDRIQGIHLMARRADLVLRRQNGGIRGELAADLDLGAPATLEAQADYDAERRELRADIAFTNIPPALLAGKAEMLAPLAAGKFPVSGKVALHVTAEHKVDQFGFDLTAGAGLLDLPQYLPNPLALDRARAKGRFDPIASALHLDQMSAEFRELALQAQGRIDIGDPPGGELSGRFHNLAVDRLMDFWPPALGVNAREWIERNIHGGMVEEATFRLNIDPKLLQSRQLADDAVALDFRFRDVNAAYFRPLPELTGVRGKAKLGFQRFSLTASEGRIGDIALSEGSLVITDLHRYDQYATAEFVGRGKTSEILALLDHEPLRLIQRYKVEPASVGGLAAVRTRLNFIVEKALTQEQIKVLSAARLIHGSVPDVALDYDVSDAALELRVDDKGLEASGALKLNGAPARISWREAFRSQNPVISRYVLKGVLDDAGRKALGYPTDPYLTGSVPAEIDIEIERGGSARLAGRFDLTPARMDIEPLGFSKAPGEAGDLRWNIAVDPAKPVRLDPFVLGAKDLSVAGSATFAADKSINEAVLADFRRGDNQIRGALRRSSEGRYVLDLAGPAYDLRPHLRAGREPSEREKELPALAVNAKFGRARVSDDLTLLDLTAALEQEKGVVRRLSANGLYAEGGKVEVTILPVGGQRALRIRSDNAGGAARYIGVTQARGGQFSVDALMTERDGRSAIKGEAVLENFKIVDAPLLAQLLSVASLLGIVDVLQGEGISFNRADLPFAIEGDVVTLEEARAAGLSLGITANGKYDQKQEVLDLDGTLIPAYTINNLLGKIPLLGTVFVGGEHEGMFALNYSVQGPVKDPTVLVNPLSALTPGMLRWIFDIPGLVTSAIEPAQAKQLPRDEASPGPPAEAARAPAPPPFLQEDTQPSGQVR
jgi:hypothetical protein